MATWQRIQVTVDTGIPESDDFGVFEAFIDGDVWNGWVVPYFTETEGQRIARWSRLVASQSSEPTSQDVVTWDAEAGTFVIDSGAYPDQPEIIPGRFVEELGQTLYGIGAYRWAWEPAVAPAP